MSMFQPVSVASAKVMDSVMSALVSGLEIEFGPGAGATLAARFLEAEEVDLHWDARVEERWIGSWNGADSEGLELDRVKVLGRLDGLWFVAIMIVDGDGNAHGMMGKRGFSRARDARLAFTDA